MKETDSPVGKEHIQASLKRPFANDDELSELLYC